MKTEYIKVVYRLQDKNSAKLALEEIKNIRIILTGKGGKTLLDDYKDLIHTIDYFDPIESNVEVNPTLPSGYKLSSYIFHVYTDKENYKLIPIYEKINLVDSE